jgi:hypothetical protein
MFLPIVGEGFVEVGIFFFGNGISLSHPDWFVFVNIFEFRVNFLHLLLFLFLWFVVFFFFNFNVFVFLFSIFFVFLFFLFIIRDFFLGSLFNLELNWEGNELRMFLDQILNSSLFQEFKVILFHVEDDFRTSGQLFRVIRVIGNGESTTG